jgi:hypothetical protein
MRNMLRPSRLTLAVLIVALAAPAVHAQDFAKAMKKIFGKQYGGYQWLDYPVDNFGVGTAYRDTRDQADPRHFLCATFTCIGISPIPTDSVRWLQVIPQGTATGFADVGCGGAVGAAIQKSSSLVIGAMLPKLLGVIGINAGVDNATTRNTSLTVSTGCSRLLTGRIRGFIQGLNEDPYGMKEALNAQQLVLIKGDVVIKSLEVTVKSTSKLKADFDAKLQGKATAVFGDSAKLGVALSRDAANDYHLKIVSPVIVGILAVRQPKLNGVGPGFVVPDLKRWTKVTVPPPPGN